MKPIDPIPALGQPKWLLDGAIVPHTGLEDIPKPGFRWSHSEYGSQSLKPGFGQKTLILPIGRC